MSGFTVGLVDPQRIILDELADKRMKQADIAASYALAMNTPSEVDWPTVNRAVVERWSLAGLRSVKERAHRLRAASVPSGKKQA